ncbi:predicted protein [Naegleria gruberi]|uniref:Predicted protein n=1 Tax=Naegleria gruberi TaxID=5762 RepID=D2VVA0_NAEGR|nr:uncharacterized protein NAEGRDRAFT_72942 [Naegleria gruberi]EFC39198.1 predicted protein [Naegleria gruberi]|eukprot:XP_002671942.1 predicted protein [Naegleria gruberi strain NEG-M]
MSENKVKITYENSYMGDIKLAHMYVDNLSGKYMYIKFNFTLNNMFHTTIEGEKSGKTKEFSVLLYPTDQHVYLTSFPVLDRYKSWKYNYTYACSIADKPTESREIYDGVFFETFHMGFGSLVVALKNNNVLQNLNGEKHIQVKINYTTLQNLTPTKTYEDFVDLYDLRVLNELTIDNKNEKTTYKYKYFIKKPEKTLTLEEISSSLLTHYSPNFSLFSSLLVERRELIPGVFGTLELTKSGSAVLSFENNNKTAVIITDVVVKGGEISYVDANLSGRDPNSPQLIVFPNETCKEFLNIKHPKGVFDISYECKVSEGKLVEENEVKPSLFVYAYFFKTFNSLLLAVKNNCEKAHMCYLFMKQMQNCTMDTDYSDQNKMMVKPYQTKLYSSIFLTDVTKPFVYSYAYQVSRVADENDPNQGNKQTILASSDSNDVKSPELQAQANIERELELSATLTGIEYMSVVSDLVKTKIESGEVFVDPDFPAETDVSVYESSFSGKRIEDIKWSRASEILGHNYEIFCDGISADDIKQGCLGDCWMLSAVAAIAAQPYLIERLFSTRSVNKAGIYELNICTGGEWTRVVVDDLFPTDQYNNSLFAHNHSAELWVMLLEKGK